jgi:hypothetical protein
MSLVTMPVISNICAKEGRKEDGVASYQKDDQCAKAAPPRHAPSPRGQSSRHFFHIAFKHSQASITFFVSRFLSGIRSFSAAEHALT